VHLNQVELEHIFYIKFESTFKMLCQSLLVDLDIYNVACADDILFSYHNLIVNCGQTFNVVIPIW